MITSPPLLKWLTIFFNQEQNQRNQDVSHGTIGEHEIRLEFPLNPYYNGWQPHGLGKNKCTFIVSNKDNISNTILLPMHIVWSYCCTSGIHGFNNCIRCRRMTHSKICLVVLTTSCRNFEFLCFQMLHMITTTRFALNYDRCWSSEKIGVTTFFLSHHRHLSIISQTTNIYHIKYITSIQK